MATQVLDWPSVYGSLTDSDKRNIRQVLTDEEYATLWFEQPSMVLPLEHHVLMVTGRGRGKSTRLAKTLRHVLKEQTFSAIGIVAPTTTHFQRNLWQEIRASFRPRERPEYRAMMGIMQFPYFDQEVKVYSGAHPDGIKGSNHDLFMLDEFAHFDYPTEVFHEMGFALRVGQSPRWVIATTPRNSSPEAVHLLAHLRNLSGVRFISGRTDENPFLSQERIAEMVEECGGEGSAQYVEQFLGEITETPEGALLDYETIQQHRVDAVDVPNLDRSVLAIDPAAEHTPDSDETGIIMAGRNDKDIYILADMSGRMPPEEVVRRIREAHHTYGVTRIVVEVNTGAAWLRSLLRDHLDDLPLNIEGVRATSGTSKYTRIEPSAALYKQGRVHHVGVLRDLETQWCSYTGAKSRKGNDVRLHDDRIDALSYAVKALRQGNLVIA